MSDNADKIETQKTTAGEQGQNEGESDIPIVSLSELLEENADIFTPIEDLLDVQESANLATKFLESLNDSDDDIEFVENVVPAEPLNEAGSLTGKNVSETKEVLSSGTSEEKKEGDPQIDKANNDLKQSVVEPAIDNVILIEGESEASIATTVEFNPDVVETDIVNNMIDAVREKVAKSTVENDVILLDDDDDDALEKMDVDATLNDKSPLQTLDVSDKGEGSASEKAEEKTPNIDVNKEGEGESKEEPKTTLAENQVGPKSEKIVENSVATNTPDEDDVIMLQDEPLAKLTNILDESQKADEIIPPAEETKMEATETTPEDNLEPHKELPVESKDKSQGQIDAEFTAKPSDDVPAAADEGVVAKDEAMIVENGEHSASTPSVNNSEVPAMPNPDTAVKAVSPTETKKRKTSSLKECLNVECSHRSTEFFPAPQSIQSHFRVNKKQKTLYICEECFDKAADKYGELCAALEDLQPLMLIDCPRPPDLVEILDSSDEEEENKASEEKRTNGDFDKDTLNMIETNLEDIISETMKNINIDQQMSWNHAILNHKMDKQREETLELHEDLKQLQRLADQMHHRLYQTTNCFLEDMPSWDSITGKEVQLAGPLYPPHGEFIPPKIEMNTLYYSVRHKMLNPWAPCRIDELPSSSDPAIKPSYKVKFLRPAKILIRSVMANHLAYGTPPAVRLNVGVRVIALFNMSAMTPKVPVKDGTPKFSFFPGIVAEPLQKYNGWRYLIFFDDGYAQYVLHENVRVVCDTNPNVWENVDPGSSDFIRNYLKQFNSRRPMVQVRKNQRMLTESNGKWINARVNDVDGSLVQMLFEDGKRLEWIYRGSTRLGPLFREQPNRNPLTPVKRNEPVIEYIVIDDDNMVVSRNTPGDGKTTPSAVPTTPPHPQRTFPAQAARETPQQQEQKRSVAKKSTSFAPPQRPQPTVQHLNNSTIYVDEDNRPKGKVVYYTAKKHLPPRKYVPHECGSSCLYEVTYNLSSYSPLSKPLLSGWERQICKSKAKKVVVYRAPCGRRLRNMLELHQYLRLTNCPLNVENFDFDFLIHCLAEYVIDKCIVQKNDIAEGTECMVVPCVNYYDNTMPPPCKYSAKRIPTKGVNLNLDTDFLCGCDCEDDCLDKTKCQCWQLTLAGAKFGNPHTLPEEVGYEFKRLPEPVPTGIYECNPRCKCKKTCLNRVAQHPLQMKLQVFKTGNRGWGLRCLNDVPKGSFICCYAGNLLTEQHANEAGENLGDEYFAELDYIEVVENLKEGYEPDVVNDDDPDDDDEYDPTLEVTRREDDSDDEFNPSRPIDINVQTRYRTRNSKQEEQRPKQPEVKPVEVKQVVEPAKAPNSEENGASDEEAERQPISFTPHSSSAMNYEKDNDIGKYKSIRKFYGKNEAVYIMDAKKSGNIGRYFNHSCAPNLFVQNVFVDTHDLRFPWVAFYALSHIRAGTELTWNYNYDVGSVPGKVLYCQCGSDVCRGRLL